MTDTNEAGELRNQTAKIMATCKWSEPGGISDTEALDQIMQLHQAEKEKACLEMLEEFRVFCYEGHAFEAWDTPQSNRQGWIDTKLREFAALKKGKD